MSLRHDKAYYPAIRMAIHPATIMNGNRSKSESARNPLDIANVAAEFVITIMGAKNRHFPGFMNR